jgi:GrpB-like predicted nucleotidyltransferase (UPF0157 family)
MVARHREEWPFLASKMYACTESFQWWSMTANGPSISTAFRDRTWLCVSDVAIAIEHVGSAAVPGLAAKPVIDLDIGIHWRNELAVVAMGLAPPGLRTSRNLGIEDREDFSGPKGPPDHHLYVCPRGSIARRNHITLRDPVRGPAQDVAAYSELNRRLAERFSRDIDRYVEGKSAFIWSILTRYTSSQPSP